MNNQEIRLHCLDLATRLHHQGSHHDIVEAGQAYLNFVGGAPLNPPVKPESDLPAYQQRVIDEKADLDQKLAGLTAFLESDKISTVDPDEVKRLEAQAKFMRQYSDILMLRINFFPKDGAQ